MENAFLEQFGIDWKLFVSQLINFLLVLTVLTFFVYKPVVKIIKKRNAKIKEGLDKAEEATVRLKEVDEIGKNKIKEAEGQSVEIIKATESRAKILEKDLQEKIEKNNLKMQKELEESYKKQQEQMHDLVRANAVDLVKKTIIKTVELKPEAIDEALIKQAAKELE